MRFRFHWFRARKAEAENAVQASQEALVEAQRARGDARANAEYLRVERQRNHFYEAVTAAWTEGTPR